MAKKNLGSKLALYPTPVTVVGAMTDKGPNWLLVAHVGIIGHDRVTISCAKQHYTNQWIRKNGWLSAERRQSWSTQLLARPTSWYRACASAA